MCALRGTILWLLLQLAKRSDAIAPSGIEALQQIPQLSYDQVALIAGNATARCQLMPQLCDWQLHLYEGHPFQVELPSSQGAVGEQVEVVTRPAAGTSTASPDLSLLSFAVPGINNNHELLIYAQVETVSKPKPKRRPKTKSNSKSKSRKRKRLLANNIMLM
ncbi:uncharacterized protein LOC115762447 [Drosophila novamexicana]|uniref:uncharacterized protein LOC115762447 n=1 Tax=Drosophila novamexicana TaxID=47314 RepID=UPI0011E5BE14|nr:uncharacterized protein LOC115762447 [Drosophila novamexicana]